ncbi:MAG: electron transport complex subunit RsxG [Pseudomonadota bacterium]|nr:electron transport complex subunit RsxG [Pseudomonadota bacterium]
MTPEPVSSILPGSLILAGLAAICTALVAITHTITAPRIAANEQAYLEQSLAPILEGIEHDGRPSESTIVISTPHDLPSNDPVTIYRVYANDSPVAAVLIVNARGGYSGPIRLLIGIDREGIVTGVRTLGHRETPGLGDLIDSDKSDWIHQFTGSSLKNPPLPAWSTRRDGGEFDQLTGATITPRAVIRSIRDTLRYFDTHRDQIFAAANNE